MIFILHSNNKKGTWALVALHLEVPIDRSCTPYKRNYLTKVQGQTSQMQLYALWQKLSFMANLEMNPNCRQCSLPRALFGSPGLKTMEERGKSDVDFVWQHQRKLFSWQQSLAPTHHTSTFEIHILPIQSFFFNQENAREIKNKKIERRILFTMLSRMQLCSCTVSKATNCMLRLQQSSCALFQFFCGHRTHLVTY